MANRRRAMRTPFDDEVFRAFAERHGLARSDMPSGVARKGWNGAEGGPRQGLPQGFPFFVFHPRTTGIGAVLAVYLHHVEGESMVRYGRSPGGRWVHVEASMLPETVLATLEGRTVGELIDVPGVATRTIAGLTVENGTVTMTLGEEARA